MGADALPDPWAQAAARSSVSPHRRGALCNKNANRAQAAPPGFRPHRCGGTPTWSAIRQRPRRIDSCRRVGSGTERVPPRNLGAGAPRCPSPVQRREELRPEVLVDERSRRGEVAINGLRGVEVPGEALRRTASLTITSAGSVVSHPVRGWVRATPGRRTPTRARRGPTRRAPTGATLCALADAHSTVPPNPSRARRAIRYATCLKRPVRHLHGETRRVAMYAECGRSVGDKPQIPSTWRFCAPSVRQRCSVTRRSARRARAGHSR